MKAITAIFILILLTSCNSKSDFVIPRSDKCVNNLYGPIEEVSEYLYSVKRTVDNIISISGEGNLVKKTIYNQNGYIKAEQIFYGSRGVDSTISTYEYNAYHQLIKIINTNLNGYKDCRYYFWNGRTAVKVDDNDIVGKMIYDKEGNLTFYSSENFKNKMQYDKFNRLVKEIYFNNMNNKEITSYFYKKRGEYETDFIGADGSRNHFRFKNIYDKWHNIVWQIYIDENNNPTIAIKYALKYYNQTN